MAVEVVKESTDQAAAAPAPVEGDRYVTEVPEVLAEVIDVVQSTPAAPAPTPVAPAQPPAAAPKPATGLNAVAREERSKRKAAQEEARRVKAEADRLKDRVTELETAPTPPPVPEARWGEVKQKVEAAPDMGAATDYILREVDMRVQEHIINARTQEEKRQMARREKQFRDDHPDYDEKLTKAGIWEGTKLVNGKHVNPEMARTIYAATDPIAKAYQLAEELLRLDRDDDEPAAAQAPQSTPSPAKPAVAAPAQAEGDATERKAAEVVATLLTPAKPQGVSKLPSAGNPLSHEFTREDLDALLDRRPDVYERLVAQDPKLGRWHLGG